MFNSRIANKDLKDPTYIFWHLNCFISSYDVISTFYRSCLKPNFRNVIFSVGFNLYEARNIKCDIITIPPNLLKKINMKNKDLEELSLETVNMFYQDALKTNYKI